MEIVDFLLENDRWKKIGPVNTIKSAIFSHTKGLTDCSQSSMKIIRNQFRNIGCCEVTSLTSVHKFEQLCEYYLPWYDPVNGKQIKFSQYMKEFKNENCKLIEYENIVSLSKSLRKGWSNVIEIILCFDTIKNVGVIVDGTHHSLALYSLKDSEDGLLEQLLKKSDHVNLCKMSSVQCSNIFGDDFKKLC